MTAKPEAIVLIEAAQAAIANLEDAAMRWGNVHETGDYSEVITARFEARAAIEQLAACNAPIIFPTDSITVNLMRLTGLDKHKARECQAIIQQMLAAQSVPSIDASECSTHPDAPHGFNRNGSHTNNRYTCDCEGWQPEPTCS